MSCSGMCGRVSAALIWKLARYNRTIYTGQIKGMSTWALLPMHRAAENWPHETLRPGHTHLSLLYVPSAFTKKNSFVLGNIKVITNRFILERWDTMNNMKSECMHAGIHVWIKNCPFLIWNIMYSRIRNMTYPLWCFIKHVISGPFCPPTQQLLVSCLQKIYIFTFTPQVYIYIDCSTQTIKKEKTPDIPCW